MDLDLHMHSTASDGSLPPEAVVEAALAARLDAIALTDHDTLAGVPRAIEAARGQALAVIPALEISTTLDDFELHILGYFVDPTDLELIAHTSRATGRREARLRGMVDRLKEQGIQISFQRVEEIAEGAAMGRPHLARAMVEAGVVQSVSGAFDLYIGNEHPAYIPTRLLDPVQAIALVRKAGGIAVWAHPSIRHLDALLPDLSREGLGGIEVYRPMLSRQRMLELERAARAAGLLITGGSDWHGPEAGPLGEFRVEAAEVAAFLEAGGM